MWTWQPRGADSGKGEGEGRREESSTLKARGQLNRERPARQKGGTRWKLTGRVWPSSPLELQAPLFVPVLPSSAPPAQPPAVPSEPAPTEPPPSQHAAAQPMGIVQFCTLLLHKAGGRCCGQTTGQKVGMLIKCICKQDA